VVQLQKMNGSEALVIGAVWTALVHVLLAILGTFVLKRFPTSFSIGFLLGIVVVLANQNLILFATFNSYHFGNPMTNRIFSGAAFTLFAVLTFFSLLLFQFKKEVAVPPTVDAKRGRLQQDELEVA
jgi:zinc transporter ZupT